MTAPLHVTLAVVVPPEQAFAAFFDAMSDWWPTGLYSVGRDKVESVVVEPQVGGRVYERWADGTEHVWGEVRAYERPERVVMSWAPGQPEGPFTEVEVRFKAHADGLATSVQLEHRHWGTAGDKAEGLRQAYAAGWPGVLARFAQKGGDKERARLLGITLNQRTWSLLEHGHRTPEDDEAMVNAAHASLHHWTEAGGPLEQARGEWLVSHVYAVLGRGEPARHHAQRSLAICQEHGFAGFDLAYAYEGMARAAAASGDTVSAEAYKTQAKEAAATIDDPEDRAVFDADLEAGPWFLAEPGPEPDPEEAADLPRA